MTLPSAFVGVIGWPLRHTLSPVIHNAAFRQVGIDWVYLSLPVPPGDLHAAIAGLRALGAPGANITMPHKENALRSLDGLSGDARAVAAVNTIHRVGDKLIGHNTDVDGFAEFLSGDAGIDASGKSAVVLGSGGAARAVVKALSDLGAHQIVICARANEKASALVGLARSSDTRVAAWGEAKRLIETSAIAVNATPLGAAGEPDLVPDAAFHPGQAVVDLVYDPPATKFVRRARAAGADAWGGLGMLVRQAASSFTIWTGQDAPLEVMSAAAVRAIGGRSEQAQN